MTALDILKSIESRGLRLGWGRGRAKLYGDTTLLSRDELGAMKKHQAELEAIAAWRGLQDEAQAKYGWEGARLYPFASSDSLRWWLSPVVRTPLGNAQLVQVRGDGAWVVLTRDLKRWEGSARSYSGPSFVLPHSDIWPPRKPPQQPA